MMSIIPPEEYLTVSLVAVGLAMDCFAVSICKGLSTKQGRARTAFMMASSFGIFQAAMPLAGFAAGTYLISIISVYDHWLAFALLGAVGSKMLWGSFHGQNDGPCGAIGMRELLVLSFATSIDALAVGLSLALLRVPVLFAAAIIGIVSFFFSLAGFYLGKRTGERVGGYAELVGGAILIAIGAKILLEHLGYL